MDTQQEWIRTFVLVLDLLGTFVFALSGAAVGIRHKLDLFGVLVLSIVAASAGGTTRDVLIGATPPAAIGDCRNLAVGTLAGFLTFLSYPIRQGSRIVAVQRGWHLPTAGGRATNPHRTP